MVSKKRNYECSYFFQPHNEQNVQECDATMLSSITAVGLQKIHLICGMRTSIFLMLVFFTCVFGTAQTVKIDTSAMLSSTGYRVQCNNKSTDENIVTISPKGFNKDVRGISFAVRGQVHKIIVDDLNNDGYADLMVCVYGGANGEMGNVAGVCFNGSDALVPAYFPDVFNDPKLREGYKGHDVFTMLMGFLQQSFPIYKSTDTDTATGGTRVVQYKLERNEKGTYNFKVLRTYDKP